MVAAEVCAQAARRGGWMVTLRAFVAQGDACRAL